MTSTHTRHDGADRDRFDVRWTPDDGVPRAAVFESRVDGCDGDGGWIRTEFEWTGEEWHELERESVTGVGCFGDGCPSIALERLQSRLTGTTGGSTGGADDA